MFDIKGVTSLVKPIVKAVVATAPKAAPGAEPAKSLSAAFTLDATKTQTGSLSVSAHAIAGWDDGPHQAAGKNTCAAASHELAIFEHAPTLHGQMLKGLKDDGYFKMPNGQELHLSEKNAKYIDSQPCSEEDKGSMRAQAAMMDYANQHEEYDMEKDVSKGADGKGQRGLTTPQTERLDALDQVTETVTNSELQAKAALQDTLGRVIPWIGGHDSHEQNVLDTTSAVLDELVDANKSLIVNIDLGDGHHSVTVSAVDKEDGTVTCYDTAGTYELDAKEFDAGAKTDDGTTGNTTTGNATDTSSVSMTPAAPTGGGARRPRAPYPG
jgi:hypothetical protein